MGVTDVNYLAPDSRLTTPYSRFTQALVSGSRGDVSPSPAPPDRTDPLMCRLSEDLPGGLDGRYLCPHYD